MLESGCQMEGNKRTCHGELQVLDVFWKRTKQRPSNPAGRGKTRQGAARWGRVLLAEGDFWGKADLGSEMVR